MVASQFTGGDSPISGQTLLDGRVAYPCSQAQARFWFEEQFQPGNRSLNVFARWRLEGEVSGLDMEEAWRTIVARHGSLRTSFAAVNGTPMQLVEPTIDFHVHEIDLTLLGEAESVAQAERIAGYEAQATFDLGVAPLIRVTLVRLRERVSILMVTAHHSVCDGWSMGILAAEMGEITAALHVKRSPIVAEPSLGYGDYSIREQRWLATRSLDAERDLLRAQLVGYKAFEVAPDKPRPATKSLNGEIASVLLEKDLTERLADLARENGCTLFMAAYAVLLALLHRRTDETDISMSTQVAGRDDVDIEGTIGTFVNTIALRTDVSDDPAFVDLLERACDAVSDAFELRHVPTEALVDIVNPKRDPSRSSLFSVNFVFQRSFVKNASYEHFRLIDLPSRSTGAIYDLCFFMVERPEGWRVSCEYNADLYEAATVDAMIASLPGIIAAVTSDATIALSEIPLSIGIDRRERIEHVESVTSAADSAASALDSERRDAPMSATEATLHGFISELLDDDRFGVDDDIFACGFHSLLALRFVAQIKAWNGVELPLRTLFDSPTVSALARHVDTMQEKTLETSVGAKPVVTLNPHGKRPPFIFLHSDLFAEGLYCRRLAAALPDQPIHAFAPHGTAGLPLLPTIEAMALDYFSRVRALQPHGPYRIGGFCVSGLVAFEFARLLQDAGEVVERVVLINASALPTRSIPPFDRLLRWVGLDSRVDAKRRTALCYNLARLHAALAQGPAAMLQFIWERVPALFGRGNPASQLGEAEPFENRHGAVDTENSLGHVVAAFTYHPKPFLGNVTLIWGNGQQTGADVPTRAWKMLSRGVRTLPVSGGHIGPLNERVEDLARVLDVALAD